LWIVFSEMPVITNVSKETTHNPLSQSQILNACLTACCDTPKPLA
jgi:hypothetical protein